MARSLLRSAGVALAAVAVMLASDVHAKTLTLRGVGTLPAFGTQPVGVVGEAITVTVTLDSDDFIYQPVANPIFHYFVPNTTVPVEIVGSITGAYPNVSPINRFVALELGAETSPGDQIGLDVTRGNVSTTLMNLHTIGGASGFDGAVTPFTSTQLLTVFEEAMQNTAVWSKTAFSSVFAGEGDDTLYLGTLEWSLVDPGGPPVQQVNVLPTFDVQLKPGNTYPLGAATATTLVIDGGAGTSFPVLDVLVDFPLDSIPSGADVRSVKLKLDAMTTGSSSLTVQALGYNGDGQAALQDEAVATTMIGSKTGPFTAAGDVTIDLDPSFIESLLSGDATHLGLRLKSATTGPFIDIAATEHATAAPPTLVVEFTSAAAGDFDFDADVDGSDFLTWQRGVGSVYEAAHLVEWTSHFGGGPEMVGAGSTTMATPEPSSALLAIGFTALASTARPGGRWRGDRTRRYNRSHGC